jgi:hypothetical protein
VLGDGGIAGVGRGAGERRAARVEADAVEPALVLVERVADAGELLLGDGVAGEPGLDLRQARLVRLLEGLEGAGELLEGARRLLAGRGGFDLGGNTHGHGSSARFVKDSGVLLRRGAATKHSTARATSFRNRTGLRAGWVR